MAQHSEQKAAKLIEEGAVEVKNYGVSPLWSHMENPVEDDSVVVELEGQKFVFSRQAALGLRESLAYVVKVKEVVA